MGRIRLLVSAAIAAAFLAAAPPAQADSVLVAHLSFAPGNPTHDPYGWGTTLWGPVTVHPAGYLSFTGRSVVKTPHRPSLNPGAADFGFGARIAMTRGVGNWNVMQKGFYNDRQWKLSTHVTKSGAQLSCRIAGTSGAVHVFTNGAVVPTNGSWHQVSCARVGTQVQVRVDGVIVARGSGPIGYVGSTRSYLIGSKGARHMADPDQYLGLLDDAWVRVDRDGGR